MIRSLFALLLALAFATTSVSAAVMHGEMQGATQLQICSDSPDGSGLMTITLDATGKAISHHRCLDCTAAIAALLPETVSTTAPQNQRAQIFSAATAHATSRAAATQSARDPPFFA